jgi:hypothetical protein
MMVLTCVDIEGTYTPVQNPDGSLAPVPPQTPPAPAAKTKIWVQRQLTVSFTYDESLDKMDGSWFTLVNNLRNSAKGYADRWGAGHPTIAETVQFLKDLNSALFTTGALSVAKSIEDGWLGEPMPVLADGDTVQIKFPFLPSYDPTEQIT